MIEPRRCRWCRELLSATAPPFQSFCGKACRQSHWRARRVSLMEATDGRPLRLAYGDPPYPGTSRKYYRDEPTFAGEVDHAALIAELVTYDGWALSTSAKALRFVLPLCPPETRVASWVKPKGVSRKTRGPHNSWEPVLFVPARRRSPGFPDYLIAHAARHGGTLPGRKPRRFWAFLFQLLGAAPGDSFDDKFPGTGGGSRHWQAVSAGASSPGQGDSSPMEDADEFEFEAVQ